MAAGDNYLGAAHTVFYRYDVGAETISNIVIFYRNSFALRHDCFEFPKVENDIGTIEPAYGTTDNFARPILKLLVNHLLLSLPNPLHHRLLGSLRCNASEIFRRDFDFYNFAYISVRLNLTRLRELDFILRISYLINDNQIRERADFASFPVDVY